MYPLEITDNFVQVLLFGIRQNLINLQKTLRLDTDTFQK